MKQVLVISGKGGTGKTSLSAALAFLGAPLVLADCDVDAANLHLLAGVDNREVSITPFFGGSIAVVEPEKCTGCGRCLELCRFTAITLAQQNGAAIAHIDATACEGCGVCVDNCPQSAIQEAERRAGDLVLTETSYGPLIWGRLAPGQPNSGKLVALVRSIAKQTASQREAALILIDGPPGVGCPVIASMGGIDAAVIVAEPSLSSLHDLERVIELCDRFNVTPYVVINKADLHRRTADEIERWCTERGITMLGRIAYDAAFSQAAATGMSISELAPDSQAANAISAINTSLLNELE